MEKIPRIFFILFISLCFITFAYAEDVIQKPDDIRLIDAYENYEKAIEMESRGDREFRRRPGKAQRMYEYAEDYYSNASFMYKQAGEEYGIDTAKEVSLCEKIYRKVHVKTNDARNKSRKRQN